MAEMSYAEVKYSFLSASQAREMAESVYRILENTGCVIKNAKARNLLAAKGCTVDGELVKIPAELTKWAIEKAPSEVTLYGRDGKPDMVLKPGAVYFGPAITIAQIYDMETGQRRYSTKQDSENAAILMDSLPNIAWVSALTSANDIPESARDVAELHAILKNTRKPVMYWAQNVKSLACEFEMFEAVGGGSEAIREKPFMVNLVCPLDPLVHTEDGMEQLMFLAERKSPAVYISGIGFGLTGPATIAGAVNLGIADTIAGLVVSQIVNPGTPFIASKFSDNVDMRTMKVTHSNPEMQVALAATADVFRYMGLPFCSNYGGTDNGELDPISMFDKSTQFYSALLTGTNMNFAMGAYESGSYCKHADLVLSNELISYLKVLTAGMEISEETLAEAVIDEVGPGEVFMAEEHTLDHIYDFWQADLMKPRTSSSKETRSFEECLNDRTRDILKKGSAHPLEKEKADRLDEIMERVLNQK